MTTYLIRREKTLTRQEGDVADIVITVPAIISMTGRTAKFQVRDKYNKVIITKSGNGLTVNGQVITIPLLPADTEGKGEKNRWELEVINSSGPITIGKGPFFITGTDIKTA